MTLNPSWLARLFGAKPAPPSAPEEAPPLLSPAAFVERRWTSVDGLSLCARDYAGGEGAPKTPVICLHGLTRNSADFEDVAPYLAAAGRRVLVPDVRGRGRSQWDPNPMNYHPGTYANDVLSLMDAAGIARAVVVGTSMGGLIAMTLAAMRPAALAGAVLNDVGPRIAPEGLARIASYKGLSAPVADWSAAADFVKQINVVAFPDYGADDWMKMARRLFEPAVGGGLRLAYDPDIYAPIRAAAGLPPADLTSLFLSLVAGRPTLLIRGALSDLITAELAADMRRLAPQMAYAEVARVGHAPMLDEPEAELALKDFLAKAP
ncbi:MAG: alpha/beta hydrolase [Pseudomonadota bacterium]|jgi:pimeloyl-ACP methyl ester carboxylesterase